MTKKDMEEITRFIMTNSQLKDAGGKIDPSHLKDLKAQVNEMVRALESATGSIVRAVTKIDTYGNAITSLDVKKSMAGVAEPVFDWVLGNIETRYGYQAGSLALDPYNSIQKTTDYRELVFHKDFHGAVAKRSAKEAMERAGGSYQPDPSKVHQDRTKLSFNVSETDWQDELAKTGGDLTKAKSNLVHRFSDTYLEDAMRYSRDTADRQKDKDEEKAEKSSKRKVFHTLTLIIGALTAIADITRRILTATLARASETKRESMEAKSLGISYGSMREYKAQEKAMGLKEGVFSSAISALQAGTGDISNLDTNMIKELAKVMQGSVNEAIQNGLGRSDPEKLMGMILDEYYRRGQLGINSLGQQVGRYNAERELSTALEKAGLADVADILRNMFYTNDTGIYKDRIGTEHAFADYMALAVAYTGGLSPTDYKKASELGAVVDSLKKTFDELKKNLETGLLIALSGIINKINSWNIGKSANEIIESNKTNKLLNSKAVERMSGLSANAKAEYESLFEESGVNIGNLGIAGVTSLDQYLAWVNTTKARGWRPSGSAKPEYDRLLQFLRTEKGQRMLRAIHYSQVTGKLAEQAKSDIEEGFASGNTVYKATDYTDSNIEYQMRELVSPLTSSSDYSAVSLYGKAYAGKNVQEALTTEDKMYQAYIEEHGGFDYEKALASKSAKNITGTLYKMAMRKYNDMDLKHKSPEIWEKIKKMSKEDAVRLSLSNKTIAPYEVAELFKSNAFKLTDWGISQDEWGLYKKAVIENERQKTSDSGAQRTIIYDASDMASVQDLYKQAVVGSKAYASVTGYDAKTGTATVKFVLDLLGNGEKIMSKEVETKTDSNPVNLGERVYLPQIIQSAQSNSSSAS